MTSVQIGLTDEELLKWFNQIHATLKRAEGLYTTATLLDKSERSKVPNRRPNGTLINPRLVLGDIEIATPKAIEKYKEANKEIIAVLQAVIKEIQEASAFDARASRWG